MTVDVRPTMIISRPRRTVAEYMFDPGHDTEWTGGITASRPAQPGRLGVGAVVERDARFLGRTFTYTYTVTDARGDEMIEMTVERPFPMVIRYELADHERGCEVAIRATGQPRGFFKLAGPLVAPRVRKSIQADLTRLRNTLQASP